MLFRCGRYLCPFFHRWLNRNIPTLYLWKQPCSSFFQEAFVVLVKEQVLFGTIVIKDRRVGEGLLVSGIGLPRIIYQ